MRRSGWNCSAGTPRPAPVNLIVRIDEGPGYPLGELKVTGNKARQHRHHQRTAAALPLVRPLDPRAAEVEGAARGHQPSCSSAIAIWTTPGARLSTDYDPERNADRAAHQVRLSVSVLERKRVDVSFQGNARLDDGDLKDVLTIFERGSYDSIETETSAAAIAQLYRSKGHPFVKVTWSADGSDPEVHRIRFTIVEGPRLRVREVSFSGQPGVLPGPSVRRGDGQDLPAAGGAGHRRGGLRQLPPAGAGRRSAGGVLRGLGLPRRPGAGRDRARARALAGAGHGERGRPRLAAGRFASRALPGPGGPAGGHLPGSLPGGGRASPCPTPSPSWPRPWTARWANPTGPRWCAATRTACAACWATPVSPTPASSPGSPARARRSSCCGRCNWGPSAGPDRCSCAETSRPGSAPSATGCCCGRTSWSPRPTPSAASETWP